MNRWRMLFLFCFGISIAAAFCMKWMERDIIVDGKAVSILNLELFWPAEKIETIFKQADYRVKTILEYHLYFDFLFMAGCFPGIASLCMIARDQLKISLVKKTLLVLAFLQLPAWAFDIIENFHLLKWLKNPVIGKEILFYHGIVYSKWIIALSGAALSLGVLLFGVCKKFFLKNKY